GPIAPFVLPGYAIWKADKKIAPSIDTAVILLDSGVSALDNILVFLRLCVLNEQFCISREAGLVVFEGQHIICALSMDLRCDCFLAAHRINGNQATRNIEQVQ